MAKKIPVPIWTILVIVCIASLGIIRYISPKYHYIDTISQAEQAVENMSPAQIIGQLFIWGIPDTVLSSASANLIRTTQPAGVILTGNFTNEELHRMTWDIKQIQSSVPMFIAIDEEGGVVRHIKNDELPGGQKLGQLNKEDFCMTFTSRSALLQKNDINTNFNIIGDVGWNIQSYMWQRTYANTPIAVADYVEQAIACSNSIVTVIKHFPGHADTAVNSHFKIPIVDKNELTWRQEDGLPFFRSIENNVGMIMVGHIEYPKIASGPASLSKKFHQIISDSQFQGLTITDDLGMLEQSGYSPNLYIKQALNAGNNLLLITTSSIPPETVYLNLLSEATQSSMLMETIQKNVQKTLEFKRENLHP